MPTPIGPKLSPPVTTPQPQQPAAAPTKQPNLFEKMGWSKDEVGFQAAMYGTTTAVGAGIGAGIAIGASLGALAPLIAIGVAFGALMVSINNTSRTPKGE